MFNNEDRLLLRDLRTALRAAHKALIQIGHKLDLNLGLSIADLALETRNMTTLAEVKAQSAALLVKAEEQDDLTLAIAGSVDDLKAQYAQVKADLEALIAAGNPSEAELQALADNLAAIDAAINADVVAKAAMKGTLADPPADPNA